MKSISGNTLLPDWPVHIGLKLAGRLFFQKRTSSHRVDQIFILGPVPVIVHFSKQKFVTRAQCHVIWFAHAVSNLSFASGW